MADLSPATVEELAWSLATYVKRLGVASEATLLRYLSGYTDTIQERRAIIALAVFKEWMQVETRRYMQLVLNPEDLYSSGIRYYRDARERYEKLHGIGTYPREDWES